MTLMDFYADLYSELLCSASGAALEACLLSPPLVDDTPDPHGVLARIWLWLRVLWRGADAQVTAFPVALARPNRAEKRLYARPVPLPRRPNPLSLILYRHVSRARYLRFVFDEGLTGRVRWCFTAWNWKWAKRMAQKENPCGRNEKPSGCLRAFAAKLTLHPD